MFLEAQGTEDGVPETTRDGNETDLSACPPTHDTQKQGGLVEKILEWIKGIFGGVFGPGEKTQKETASSTNGKAASGTDDNPGGKSESISS